MTQVRPDFEIEWGGEKYIFTPSNRILRRIDAELSPSTHLSVLMQLEGAMKSAASDPMAASRAPFSSLALMISEFIKAGGGNVSEDDVYDGIMQDLSENEGRGLPALIEAVIVAVTPPERVTKNSEPPAAGGKKKAASRK